MTTGMYCNLCGALHPQGDPNPHACGVLPASMAKRPTGAPLRQQIAEAIHNALCGCDRWPDNPDDCDERLYPRIMVPAADAVLALLNLTEEHGTMLGNDDLTVIDSYRYVTPWLPTPPDTSSATQNVGPNEKV